MADAVFWAANHHELILLAFVKTESYLLWKMYVGFEIHWFTKLLETENFHFAIADGYDPQTREMECQEKRKAQGVRGTISKLQDVTLPFFKLPSQTKWSFYKKEW